MGLIIKEQINLAKYTSFGVGGNAENFVITKSARECLDLLENNKIFPVWVIGYGSNVLISDAGLQGLVICLRGGETIFKDNELYVDAGVWWDDIVNASIEKNLWGIELLSKIPGSLGGALFINIAAYGQSIGKVVKWVDVWNITTQKLIRLTSKELVWEYKDSVFQKNKYVIIRACLLLSHKKTDELTYQKALDVAEELKLDSNKLEDRRKIIIESRIRAGSIWDPEDSETSNTVGSFFKNPEVSPEQTEEIIKYDESGKTSLEIRNMNKVHGGTANRVSAAHVMLASGFKRGQTWGNVKLNDQNLLKIEALPGATAQEIYSIVIEIQKTCIDKLGIMLMPEAQILGKFE
jgi:UDP-N-acetylmuramate dehydrogenase